MILSQYIRATLICLLLFSCSVFVLAVLPLLPPCSLILIHWHIFYIAYILYIYYLHMLLCIYFVTLFLLSLICIYTTHRLILHGVMFQVNAFSKSAPNKLIVVDSKSNGLNVVSYYILTFPNNSNYIVK